MNAVPPPPAAPASGGLRATCSPPLCRPLLGEPSPEQLPWPAGGSPASPLGISEGA